MKTNSKLIVGFAIVASLIVGFLFGLFIEYPKIDNDQLSGTIGRVNNYRNTKATDADIELKNDLLTNEDLRKSMGTYMGFYYAKSLEFGNTITYAIEMARSEEAFATQHANQIETMEHYAAYLENSRKDLLMATLVCQSVEKSTPEMLRNSIAQANNTIAQMNHRNSSVITFIEVLDAYITTTGTSSNESLNQAHDLLVFNQISASMATRDKIMLKYLDKKQLFAKDIQTAPTDIKSGLIKDMEKLNVTYYADMEKLGKYNDMEKLGKYNDIEKLGSTFALDSEKLGIFFDSEKLGTGYTDTEKLGAIFTDAEKLGAIFTDAEKLGLRFTDAEKLGIKF
jgi:hypothetical protein